MSRLKPALGTAFLLLVTAISAQLMLEAEFRQNLIMPVLAIPVEQAPIDDSRGLARRNAQPKRYYNAITERPLFELTRRPIEFKEPEPEIEEFEEVEEIADEVETVFVEPEKEAYLPEIQLMGVLLTGSTPSVFLSVDGDGAEWYRQGDALGDWSLKTVASDYVEFSNNKKVVRVDLYNRRAE